MLVKSDKTPFVLVLRSSEKLSFNPFKKKKKRGAIEKKLRRFHCDFLRFCPHPKSGVCMSDSAGY